MLPRDHRLHPRSRVRTTQRRGRRVRSGAVVVHYLADSATPQAAVVAGRAVGPAVNRHRRQRQVRHALAAAWADLPGGSYVVRILPGDQDYSQLERDLRAAVSRL